MENIHAGERPFPKDELMKFVEAAQGHGITIVYGQE